MKYKLPTGAEKRRIIQALESETFRMYRLRRQFETARPKGKRLVFNPFSGRFRIVRFASSPRKNEVNIIGSIAYKLQYHLVTPDNPMFTIHTIRAAIHEEFAECFEEKIRALVARGHWDMRILAAERLLEIANERRTDYDD